ncbi:MAG: hypothetical protein WCI51_06035 [Lentisphaerota bacterium]
MSLHDRSCVRVHAMTTCIFFINIMHFMAKCMKEKNGATGRAK